MEKFFHLKENNTTVRTEIAAGLTTFFAMAYIVFVNPDQVAAQGANGWLAAAGADPVAMGKIWNAVYIGSVLAAVFATLLMAVIAKLPYVLACGMGLNSFFCTTFVAGAYFSGVDVIEGYHSGLVLTFVSGVIFLLLSVTGLRTYIAKAMPDCLKKAIPAGIGLFIALVGFKNAGIIQANQYTLVQFVDIRNGEWTEVAPAIVALLGVLIIGILAKLKVKGNVILGIIGAAVLYYIFTGTVPSFDMSSAGQAFKDFGEIGFLGFFSASAWSDAFSGPHIGSVFNAVMLIITFCLVDMFDTLGTLYGTAAQANMLDENGDPIRVDKAMLCDSVGTVAGAFFGTSTCTTFVESSAGVAEGGRTGLTSLVAAMCFFICLFLSPLASIVPSCATASALIYVGVLMVRSFAKVDMDDPRSAVPAFITLIMMPLTYSISNGIGLGAIFYVIMTLCTGNFKKKDMVVTVIALLFVIRFMFVTM
ncbi:MAG: NCS2 family permease [Oscillospiraceae bacterium]